MIYITGWFVLGIIGALLFGKILLDIKNSLSIADILVCFISILIGPITIFIALSHMKCFTSYFSKIIYKRKELENE